MIEAKYVVIGGGIAGMSCIDGISILDKNAPVVLISASPYIKAVTYVTPITKMLTEYIVEEKSYDDVSLMYPSLRIIKDAAIRISTEKCLVETVTSQIIKYEKLCICTGASPKVISPNNEFVICIRDTDSAELLQNKLKSAKRVVVVGNGGIATEIVYEIEGVDIIWVIKDKHISATFIDPGAAEFFQDNLCKIEKKETSSVIKTIKYTTDELYESKLTGAALGPNWHDKINLINKNRNSSNVTVEYETEIKNIWNTKNISLQKEEDWSIYVELNNGKTYGCDFVVSAIGVIPNSENILVENGSFELSFDKGIKVNSQMETNLKNIYAAGDVCTASWIPARHWFQMRLWTQARQMGSYAARCMVNAIHEESIMLDFCFEMFTHVTRFFGYKVILLGLFNAQTLEKNYELMLRVTKKQEYIKLVISDNKLQGALLIGDTDLEEMCENLILNQLDISEFGEDLLNPDIDIEDYFD